MMSFQGGVPRNALGQLEHVEGCTPWVRVRMCGGVCTHLGNVLECGEVCVHLGNVLECATSLCSRINIPSLPH